MDNLGLFNIAIDGYSVLLCAILAAYVLASGERRDRANLCFAGICLCNAVMALGDIASWMYEPPLNAVQHGVMLGGSFLFFAAPVPLFLFFTGYIVAFLSKRVDIPRNYDGVNLMGVQIPLSMMAMPLRRA